MIVRDADRFGISQLHQLRGRLVRNGGQGVFIMMVEDLEAMAVNSPQTLERLYAIEESTDGYELAERDLVIRGFGDMEGSAQSGETKTLFKMVRMTAADFLHTKFKSLQIERTYSEDESQQAPSQIAQPRLF